MTQFRGGPAPRPESFNDWKSYAAELSLYLNNMFGKLEQHSRETDSPTKETYSITGYTSSTGAIDFTAPTTQQVANVLGSLVASLNAKGITRTKS